MGTVERAVTASDLVEVAEDVFAFVQAGGGWCVNNAGVIRGGGRVALVDTAATEARALRLRELAARVGPAPSCVVNTHFHGDHTFGNHVFAPATVVGLERTRADMAAAGLHLTGLWPSVEWGELRLEPPTLVFRDHLTVHLGRTRVELRDVGPAHTTADVVAWLPDQRVLFTGDVVLSGVTPFVPMGSVDGSLAAVERLRALGPRTVVTGHGPVAGPEVFDATEAYLHRLREIAADGAAAGLSPLAAAREAGPGGFAHWVDPERLVPNLHRAYADARADAPGTGVDLAGSFAEMVEYHGGPLRCDA